jgi:hypothetical protein
VIHGELLATVIVHRDVVAVERNRQRRLACHFQPRRAVRRERELELGAVIDVDHLPRALGGGEHVHPAFGVDAHALERLVAAGRAERVAPFARRRVHVDQPAFGVGDIDVARGIGDHRDRALRPPRLALRGLGHLADENPVAREDLHAAVAAVGYVEIVGDVHAADVGKHAVA